MFFGASRGQHLHGRGGVDAVDEQVGFFRHVEVASKYIWLIFGDDDQTTSGPCSVHHVLASAVRLVCSVSFQSCFLLYLSSCAAIIDCANPASVRHHCPAVTLPSMSTCPTWSRKMVWHRRGCFSTNSLGYVVCVSLCPVLIVECSPPRIRQTERAAATSESGTNIESNLSD